MTTKWKAILISIGTAIAGVFSFILYIFFKRGNVAISEKEKAEIEHYRQEQRNYTDKAKKDQIELERIEAFEKELKAGK